MKTSVVPSHSPPRSRIVAITGVSRGLGAALVDELIRLGHRIVGCARSKERMAAMQREYGAPHDFTAVDVVSLEQVKSWAARILQTHGPPDLLINNAALINRTAPLWQVDPAEFSAVIDVNIKGLAHTIYCFAPAMVARGTGVIVNLSSGWGRSTDAGVAPYCATKWAVEGLTQALAQELPKGMSAVPLNPGIIDTEMLRSCFGESAASYPSAAVWARRAAPFLLKLGPSDNGRPLTVP